MTAFRLSSALLAMAVLTGCAGYQVRYDYDVTATFSRYKTFDYYTSKKGTGGTTSLMDTRVRTDLEKELEAKGYRMETKADPDFLVTYYPIVRQRRYRTTTHVGWGWGWGYRPFYGRMGTSVSEVHTYKEGTIVIEMVDFKTNRLIWQGAAEGALTGLDNPEDANEVVARAVHDILAKFPPK
jgi:hypothetical protein